MADASASAISFCISSLGRCSTHSFPLVADVNDDGWQDPFVANLDREDFAIYCNNHDGTFDDSRSGNFPLECQRLIIQRRSLFSGRRKALEF